jgi:Flp pilus assembly protein TadG
MMNSSLDVAGKKHRAALIRLPQRRRRARGVAAVEFALLLLPMLIMCFGVVEYGRTVYQYNSLAKAVRDSVRLLAQASPDDANYPVTAARCLAVHGNVGCTGPALVPGLATSHVVICDRANACAGGTYTDVPTAVGAINLVEVRVSGFALPFIGLPFLGNGESITFNDIRATMRQVS